MQRGEENAHIAVLVGVVFVLVSTLLIVGLCHAVKEGKAKERRRSESPDEPWMWRQDWAEGFARFEGGRKLIGISVFALIWNLISWSVLFAAWHDIFGPSKEKMARLALLFPVIGVFLIGSALYTWLQNRKFGESVFRMLSCPGVLGGTLNGAVEIPSQLRSETGFKVRLRCVHRDTTGSGEDRTPCGKTKRPSTATFSIRILRGLGSPSSSTFLMTCRQRVRIPSTSGN